MLKFTNSQANCGHSDGSSWHSLSTPHWFWINWNRRWKQELFLAHNNLSRALLRGFPLVNLECLQVRIS